MNENHNQDLVQQNLILCNELMAMQTASLQSHRTLLAPTMYESTSQGLALLILDSPGALWLIQWCFTLGHTDNRKVRMLQLIRCCYWYSIARRKRHDYARLYLFKIYRMHYLVGMSIVTGLWRQSCSAWITNTATLSLRPVLIWCLKIDLKP